jgi:hypothetical protein
MLALPYTAMGSFFLDSRVGIAAAMLLVAAVRTRRIGRGDLRGAVAVLVALTAFRNVGLAIDWRSHDGFYEEVLAGLDRLPAGSLVVPSSAVRFQHAAGWLASRDSWPPEEHAASYATIRRDAVVPNVFAKAGQNPLVLVPPNQAFRDLVRNPIFRVRTEDALERLVGSLRAYAATGDPLFGEDRLFIVAFGRGCQDWPARTRVRLVHCGRGFSLVGLGEPQEPEDPGLVFTGAASEGSRW